MQSTAPRAIRPALAFEVLICVIVALQRKRKVLRRIVEYKQGKKPMLDLILLALGLGFFALAVGYTIACDRL